MRIHAEPFEKFGAQAGQMSVATIARSLTWHGDDAFDAGTGLRRRAGERAEKHDPVTKKEGLIDVVRNHHDGGGLDGVNFKEKFLHGEPGERVEGTEWFVEHQNARCTGEGARE